MSPIFSRKTLLQILKENQIQLSKHRGQNFLLDQNILNKIIESSNLSKEDIIIEIGGGMGHLTYYLSQILAELIVFEVDKKLYTLLNEQFKNISHVSIYLENILNVDFNQIYKKYQKKLKIIANLPYSITTPILDKCFKQSTMIESMTCMVQKELAERILAKPGTRDYSPLSIFCQTFAECKYLFNISKNVFFPVPKIDSALIQLNLNQNISSTIHNLDIYFQVVKVIFSNRRKTIYNNFKKNPYLILESHLVNEIFNKSPINPDIRGENLTIDQIIDLSNMINSLIKKRN